MESPCRGCSVAVFAQLGIGPIGTLASDEAAGRVRASHSRVTEHPQLFT